MLTTMVLSCATLRISGAAMRSPFKRSFAQTLGMVSENSICLANECSHALRISHRDPFRAMYGNRLEVLGTHDRPRTPTASGTSLIINDCCEKDT